MANEQESELRRTKEGRSWRIGQEADVAWIQERTPGGLAITSAIPPVFEAYATLEQPGTGNHSTRWSEELQSREDAGVLEVLVEHTDEQPWWLGYLDTSPQTDTVFDDVPKVSLYADWPYVLVEAGPEQAAAWRKHDRWNDGMPELMFPMDRSWLASTLWDDDWMCIGGQRGWSTHSWPIGTCDRGFARSISR